MQLIIMQLISLIMKYFKNIVFISFLNYLKNLIFCHAISYEKLSILNNEDLKYFESIQIASNF